MSHLHPPTADQVKAARTKASQTQAQAAQTVHSTDRRWRTWESGNNRMHPGLWELYLLRTQAIIMSEPADLAALVDQGVNAS